MSRRLNKKTKSHIERIADSLLIGQAKGRIGRVLAITSCHGGEGTPAVTLALANSLAEKGESVLVVGPSGEGSPAGSFLQLLGGEGSPPAAAADTSATVVSKAGVRHLPMGGDLTAAALKGGAFDRALEKLAGEHDWILFDLPSYFDHRLSGLLISRVKDTILIARHLSTSNIDIQQVRSLIERDGGRIVGAVMTRYKQYIPQFVSNLFGPVRTGERA